MVIEFKLLSKIIDEGNFTVLNKFNITENDFTEGLKAYQFVKSYWNEHNDVPSPSTVAEECEFDYIDTTDKIEYLVKTVKNNTAKRKAFDLLQNHASDKFNTLKGTEFVDWMTTELDRIKEVTNVGVSSGTNFATNGAERWEWYEEVENNGKAVSVPTPYPKLTEALAGGNDLGDYLLLLAYTNQGKSWIASQFGLTAWGNDFGVLHYSPEMSKKQTMARLDTLKGHFSNVHIGSGQLYNKDEYKAYLGNFTPENTTPYLVKTMEDLNNGLSVSTIEADLMANPEIKFVIIDGFNLMTHKGNDGNRNNMSSTSRKLRQMFSRYGVVGMVVHHTPTTSRKENLQELENLDDGFPVAPKLTDYSETVAVIQDAVTVLTFGYKDGLGKLAVRKARKPCVDFETNLHVNYNLGFITEVDLSANKGGNENVF